MQIHGRDAISMKKKQNKMVIVKWVDIFFGHLENI